MKIIHITASYKPAYIYGGPIQSVGKLCEALQRFTVNDKILQKDQGESFNIDVLTTTANGKQELDIEAGKMQIVESVAVTYFKRWTKDHSHFSPGLLWALRKSILKYKNPPPAHSQSYAPPSKGGKGSFETETFQLESNNLEDYNNDIVVHIHAWWNLVSMLSCWVAKWYKIPVILSPRGMLTSYTIGNRNSLSKKILHNLLGKRLLKYVHIHATSEKEKEDILKIVQPKSITVIPNLVGFLEGEASIKYQVSISEDQDFSNTFRIIFLSRIEEKKGLDLLFEALALLDFSWSLTIAGSGNEVYVRSLKAKAESLKLNNQIIWLGQIANEDKFDLMQNSDLLVLTSHNENFANVIIESLSVGTAVLVSEHVGLADYVKEKDLGWISALNPIQIGEQITSSYRDTIKRAHIREVAPSIISQDYKDEVLVKKYINLYNRVLNG
ncbi:XrtY-associated glycosyltransferase XYAG1 [Pedobacter fastidiosus]|uniref:Glycosyltransferase n=1 Tax=Pedobacter fastidiosus TaxID=2765361 RepID=A0ABR7KWS0_9SPHI|nr:glycosyltransferase [Pedobacter fastidiosus]MBC6112148.1 glycosyltransferase [Pedobacter fastidiosus]